MVSDLITAPKRPQLAGILWWAAIALYTIFTLTILSAAIPLNLGSALWQLQLSDVLISQSPIALLATCLVFLSSHLDEFGAVPAGALRWCTRAAGAAGVGYALLIPVLIVASWTMLNPPAGTAQGGAEASMKGLEQVQARVKQAGSQAQLQDIYGALPKGLPALASLGPDLPSQRQGMGQLLERIHGRLSMQVNQERQRRQLLMGKNVARLGLSSLVLACLYLGVATPLPATITRMRRGSSATKAEVSSKKPGQNDSYWQRLVDDDESEVTPHR
jgi:hypothetical protein